MAEPVTAAKALTPVEYLAEISPEASEAFQSLRKAVMDAGPLDHNVCELITLGAFATTGNEASLKTHARRLVKEGADVSALRQAVLVTFAATATFSQIIAGLRWIDDIVEKP